MKKQLFFFATIASVAAMTTTSCTSDDLIATLPSSNQHEIRFQTNISAMTRAITTGSNLNQFKTTAYLNQQGSTTKLMSEVAVNNENGVWKPAETYFWPYDGKLTFYSVAPASLNTTMPEATELTTTAPTFRYVAASDAASQSDILYAVNANHEFTGSAESSVVNVNFRHALAQVVFKAKCENPNWQVDISDVKIFNVASTGNYTLPRETTAPLAAENNVRGSWTLAAPLNNYNAGISQPQLNIDATERELTSSAYLPLLLLPQTTTAWDPKADPECNNRGSYFAIRCQIRQKTADNNWVIVWPASGESSYVDVGIPVSLNLEEGKKYTYTFNFKNGAGYILPDRTGAGKDVLPGANVMNSIMFNVQVDNFGDTTTNDIEL